RSRTALRTPERRTRRRRPAPPLPTAASTSRPSRAPAPWSSEVGRDRHEERVVRHARLLPALHVELVVELDDGLEAVRPEVHAEGPALASEAVEVDRVVARDQREAAAGAEVARLLEVLQEGRVDAVVDLAVPAVHRAGDAARDGERVAADVRVGPLAEQLEVAEDAAERPVRPDPARDRLAVERAVDRRDQQLVVVALVVVAVVGRDAE